MKRLIIFGMGILLCLMGVLASQVTLDTQGNLRYTNGTLYDGSVSYTKYYLSNGTEVFYYEESASVDVSNGIWNVIIGRNTSLNTNEWLNYMQSSINVTTITEINGENASEVILSYVPLSIASIKSNDTDYFNGQLATYYLDNNNETPRVDNIEVSVTDLQAENISLWSNFINYLTETTIYAIIAGNRTEIEASIDNNISDVRTDIDNNFTALNDSTVLIDGRVLNLGEFNTNFTSEECDEGNYTYGTYDNGTIKCRPDAGASGSGDITSVNTASDSGLEGGASTGDVSIFVNESYFSERYNDTGLIVENNNTINANLTTLWNYAQSIGNSSSTDTNETGRVDLLEINITSLWNYAQSFDNHSKYTNQEAIDAVNGSGFNTTSDLDGRYLQSYIETDPFFKNESIAITSGQITDFAQAVKNQSNDTVRVDDLITTMNNNNVTHNANETSLWNNFVIYATKIYVDVLWASFNNSLTNLTDNDTAQVGKLDGLNITTTTLYTNASNQELRIDSLENGINAGNNISQSYIDASDSVINTSIQNINDSQNTNNSEQQIQIDIHNTSIINLEVNTGNSFSSLPNLTMNQITSGVNNGTSNLTLSDISSDGFIKNVVEDTTPDLGGELNMTIFNQTSSNGNVIRQNETHIIIGG